MFERIKNWFSEGSEQKEKTSEETGDELKEERLDKLSYDAAIKEIKEKDNFPIIKLDVLRTLIDSFGRRWKSELLRDLNIFRKQAGRAEVEEDHFDNALDRLERYGLISSDDRPRARKGGSEPDSLISLNNFEKVKRAFSDDKDLEKYRKSRKNL